MELPGSLILGDNLINESFPSEKHCNSSGSPQGAEKICTTSKGYCEANNIMTRSVFVKSRILFILRLKAAAGLVQPFFNLFRCPGNG